MPYSTRSFSKAKQFQDIFGLICALLMTAGFFYSRALLSIGTFLIFLNFFWPQNIRDNFVRLRSNPLSILAILYFFVYLVSYFWSDDKAAWLGVIRLKLPFLLLPIGLLTLPFADRKCRDIYIYLMLIMVCCNIFYSLTQFVMHYEDYLSGYAHSKQIPTIKSGDHIRFSLWLSVCLLLIKVQYDALKGLPHKGLLRKSLIGVGILIFIFIHVLSAKTGLMALYLILGAMLFVYLTKKMNALLAFLLPVVMLFTLAFFAYKAIPTFQEKVKYVSFEIEKIQNGEHLDYNYSDMGRLISYKVSLRQINSTGILGSGAGDISHEMNKGYDAIYPEVPQESRFVPINQYLVEVLGFGWILSIVYVLMVVASFFYTNSRHKVLSRIVLLVMIASMMVEAMLQVQLGIFVYLFLTYLWMYWDNAQLTTLRLKRN